MSRWDDEYGTPTEQDPQQPPDLPPNGGGDWGYQPVPADSQPPVIDQTNPPPDNSGPPPEFTPTPNEPAKDPNHTEEAPPDVRLRSGSSNDAPAAPANPYADTEAKLRAEAARLGIQYDPSDLAGIVRNTTYGGNSTTKSVSLDQALKNAFDNYKERATNTPGVDASGAHTGVSWWPGGANNPTPTSTGGGGTTNTRTTGGGTGGVGMPNSGKSLAQTLADLKALGIDFAGPGTSGVFPSDQLQQVGQDPFSQAISGGYMSMLGNEGQTSLGKDLDATLRGLISRGGAITDDPATRAARFEAARQPIESMRKAQTAQMRGSLANRGLISEPGQPQGAEIGAVGRMEEQLAPYYATAGQNLAGAEQDANNARLSQSLQLATGLSTQESQTFLQTLGDATQRQQVLSNIALGTLDRNILWNKFLAEFGLQRAQVLMAAQQGQMDQLQPLLQLFAQYVNMSNNGYI